MYDTTSSAKSTKQEVPWITARTMATPNLNANLEVNTNTNLAGNTTTATLNAQDFSKAKNLQVDKLKLNPKIPDV